MRVWLLAFAIMLSGCFGTSEPEPQEAPQTTSVETVPDPPVVNETVEMEPQPISIPYWSRGCDAVVFVHAVDFAEANQRLPLGFVAADLGELLDLGVRLDKAAIGLVAYSCESDSRSNFTFHSASVAIFVDAPVLNGEPTDPDGIFINAYEMYRIIADENAVLDHASIGWDIDWGIDIDIMYAVREPLPDAGVSTREPNPLAAQTIGTLDGEEVWNGGILGGTTYHMDNRTNRFWHLTEAGISYDEYRLDKNGRGATSVCTYGNSIFQETIGRDSCAPGENLGIGIQAFNVEGALHHLPGVYP